MMRYTAFLTRSTPTAHKERPAEPRAEREVPVLSAQEEAFLSGITSSGQFTLAKARGMYAGVKRLRGQK